MTDPSTKVYSPAVVSVSRVRKAAGFLSVGQ